MEKSGLFVFDTEIENWMICMGLFVTLLVLCALILGPHLDLLWSFVRTAH